MVEADLAAGIVSGVSTLQSRVRGCSMINRTVYLSVKELVARGVTYGEMRHALATYGFRGMADLGRTDIRMPERVSDDIHDLVMHYMLQLDVHHLAGFTKNNELEDSLKRYVAARASPQEYECTVRYMHDMTYLHYRLGYGLAELDVMRTLSMLQ
jgi:hypothetical protein